MIFLQQYQKTRGRNRFCLEVGGGGPNNVYMSVNVKTKK
jgi:hypothetical protein